MKNRAFFLGRMTLMMMQLLMQELTSQVEPQEQDQPDQGQQEKLFELLNGHKDLGAFGIT
jgi:hypothetical protein